MNYMQKVNSDNYMMNNGAYNNQMRLGNSYNFTPRNNNCSKMSNWASNCSSNMSNYSNEDLSYDSYEEEDTQANFLVGQAQNYCEATRAKKRNFVNAEERYQFKQQYESKKKTELCKNFEMYGRCKYGDSCSYAHGAHQLQKKTHLPSNFMTKLCTQFHRDGVCMYGERCQFLHSTYDLKTELTYGQALSEGARLTDRRNNQISKDTQAECLWANLKTGDGCGAPKKPRLPIFEKIYNKDQYYENMNQIQEEESVEKSSQMSKQMSTYSGYQQQNMNMYCQSPAPVMNHQNSYNSYTNMMTFNYQPQQPSFQKVMSYNQNSNPMLLQQQYAMKQTSTTQVRFDSFFKQTA